MLMGGGSSCLLV